MLEAMFNWFWNLVSYLRNSPQTEDLEANPSANTPLAGDLPVRIAGCAFCSASRANGFNIFWEDATFVVFKDRNPAAQHHLLVIPRDHIESVKSLSMKDIPLVRSMEDTGHRILTLLDIPQSERRLGFHIPPFNSVPHLHLHLFGLPFKNLYRRAKYPVAEGSASLSKGFSWFVDASQVINILQKGHAVGVLPC